MTLKNTPFLKLAALGLIALVAIAAAPQPAAKPPQTAHKTAHAPAASPALDVRDPAALISVLGVVGAKAEVARREGDAVFLTVTSPTEVFSAQFAGCDDKGRNCQAVLFDRQGDTGQPTLAQLNAFNQSSVLCRLYQDKGGRPHVEYSALLLPQDGRRELLMHVNAWRGCIGDFTAFEKDPADFLANAA